MLSNAGLGGALFAIAAESAERTASANGSSTCAPARTLSGSAPSTGPNSIDAQRRRFALPKWERGAVMGSTGT